MIEVLCEHLRRSEGLRLEAYLCPGKVWTIGYGATRTLGKRPVREGQVITEATAEKLLLRDAQKTLGRIVKALRPDASDGAKVAFASLAYNMGTGRIIASKAMEHYNARRMDEAERHFRQWRLIDGEPSKGLEARRDAEWRLVRDCEGN